MADVIDNASGQVVQLPDDQVHDAWKAGKASLIADADYQLRFPNGAYGFVKGSEAGAHVQSGAAFVAPAEAQSALAERAAFERHNRLEGESLGPIGAGLAGGISQATFGLSDLAGSALLGDHFKEIRQYQEEEHPYASAIGEGLGAAALTAATGVGGLAERAGAGLVGDAASTLVGRVAQRAAIASARGLVEGAQYGIAKAASDDAFADHRLTAEQILASVGTNALLGGTLAGGLGGLGGIFSELRGGGSRALAQTMSPAVEASGAAEALAEGAVSAAHAPTDRDLAAVAARAMGQGEPAEGLGAKVREWYARGAGAVSGKDPELIRNVLENRADLLDADATRDAASRAIRGHVDNILKSNRDLGEIWERGVKRSYIAKAVEGVEPEVAAKAANDVVDRTFIELYRMGEDPDAFGGAAALKNAMKVAKGVQNKLAEAVEAGDVGEMYGLVDDLKKGIGKYAKGAANQFSSTDELASMQIKARAAKYLELYNGLRSSLEDETTWGEMGAKQKAINAAYTQQLDAASRFNRALTTEIGRDEANPFRAAKGVDPAKADSYVRNLTNPSQDLTHKAVLDYVDGSRRLAEAMSEAFDLPAQKVAQVDAIRDAATAFRSTLDDTTQRLQTVNQFQQLKEQTAGHASGLGFLVGHMAHGAPGGIAGLALGKVASVFTRPADTIHQLAVIEKMVRTSDNRIARAIRSFGRGEARRAAAPALDTFPRRAAKVERMAADMAGVSTRVGASVANLRRTAPRMADALTASALAGVTFLQSKLPPARPGDPLAPAAKPPLPTPAQRASFLRYDEAVRDPLRVVENLRDGRLSLEGVETLKTVYPSLYQRVREHAFDAMQAGHLSDLTSQQRLGMSILLELPTPELSPEYVMQRQAAYAQAFGGLGPAGIGADEPQQPKPHRSKPVDLSKQAALLPADRLEAGVSS